MAWNCQGHCPNPNCVAVCLSCGRPCPGYEPAVHPPRDNNPPFTTQRDGWTAKTTGVTADTPAGRAAETSVILPEFTGWTGRVWDCQCLFPNLGTATRCFWCGRSAPGHVADNRQASTATQARAAASRSTVRARVSAAPRQQAKAPKEPHRHWLPR
ncbi:hypothetical protein FPQ18DRAFT_310006 [Pyronema domesticum]|nr:hypothetical protein FPQ18DRAFT_310006 [Pyronema domesticum]